MFNLNDSNRFFLYPYPTDMRKSFYSLSGIVTNLMGMNVQDGDAYIFINKSLIGLKILHAEYGGLVIYNMKLERGAFKLPDIDPDDDRTRDIPFGSSPVQPVGAQEKVVFQVVFYGLKLR